MSRANNQKLIMLAYNYNAKARGAASCNQLYMGSMATAMLMGALGGEYGRDDLAKLVKQATDEQLDAGVKSCENIIRYGKLRELLPTDWPLELRIVTGEVKRGTKFHGTKRQLTNHLRILNSVGTGGVWDVDRKQLPDHGKTVC